MLEDNLNAFLMSWLLIVLLIDLKTAIASVGSGEKSFSII
jgi:hypothetical protein